MLAYLTDPRRLTWFSLLALLIILVLEAVGINLAGQTLPTEISSLNARDMLQSLIGFDGVFFGFSAIVFSTLVSREATFERISFILTAMIATVILFVLSVVAAFYSLASITSSGLPSGSFTEPLEFVLYGTTVFFFMIYLHVLRSKMAYK